MHATDLLSIRSVPFAGLFMAVTRRCPLHCAHCSTNSMLASEEAPAAWLLRLAESFTADDRPEVLFLSGGEPLLRPALVCELAARAHAVGTRVAMITGAYFADTPTPPALQRAIDAVDLLTVSIDVFHEQEVSRRGVFDLLERRLDGGGDANLQTIGTSPSDPYLVDLVADVHRRFGTRLPVPVGQLGPTGRSGSFLDEHRAPRTDQGVPVLVGRRRPAVADDARAADAIVVPVPAGCSFASWPVVAFDGTIAACCNQTVIDGPVPTHLRLGHASDTTWTELQAAARTNRRLRAVRVYGPEYLAARAGHVGEPGQGYCDTCVACGPTAGVAAVADALVATPTFDVIESIAIESNRDQPLRSSMPGYQHLVYGDLQPDDGADPSRTRAEKLDALVGMFG